MQKIVDELLDMFAEGEVPLDVILEAEDRAGEFYDPLSFGFGRNIVLYKPNGEERADAAHIQKSGAGFIGVPDGENFYVKLGHNQGISRGKNGAVYFVDSLYEAFGMSTAGIRIDDKSKWVNEGGMRVDGISNEGILFQVAQGVKDRPVRKPAGGEAAHFVLVRMLRGAKDGYLLDEAAGYTLDEMPNYVVEEAGATYAGVKINVEKGGRKTAEIMTVGDPVVVVVRGGRPVFTSKPHALFSLADLGLNREVREVEKSLNGLSAGALRRVKEGLVFPYEFPSHVATSSFRSGDAWVRKTSENLELESGDYIVIYSAGVGTNYTPRDLAGLVAGFGKRPLHLDGLDFAREVTDAQSNGRKIDIGTSTPPYIKGTKANMTFWIVKIK